VWFIHVESLLRRQRVALVLGGYVVALGDTLDRYTGDAGPSERERFGRAETARAARIEEPHLRVVPPLGDAEE